MRQQAWDEVKIALRDYPHYDRYINEIRQKHIYPYIPTDSNIGGSRGSRDISGLDGTVVSIADDMMLNRIIFQKKMINDRLSRSESWVRQLIALMYFGDSNVRLSTASELVGRDRRTGKKYHNEFMEGLAKDLGVIR